MRAAISALGLSLGLACLGLACLGLASAAIAMPTASPPARSNAILAHGCHHYYAHDLSGWHRHDKACGTLRGLVGGKPRGAAKS